MFTSRGARTPAPLVVLLAAAALLAAGCSTPLRGDAARFVTGAGAEVGDGQDWAPLDRGDGVPSGRQVRAGEEEAQLQVGSTQVWLAPGTAVEVDHDVVELLRGEVAVRGDGAVEVRWLEVVAAGAGTMRLRSGSAPRVGVYEGSVEVVRPGEQRTVGALRELALLGRRLAVEPSPLRYREDNDWDRRWLAAAIAFDGEASRLIRGIEREYGTAPQPPDFYASFTAVEDAVVPLLARVARARGDDGTFGPPADTLLTLFVAQAAAGGRLLRDTLNEVASLRVAGARWGLVAVEIGIGTEELAAAVDLGQELRVAAGGPPPVASPGAPGPAQTESLPGAQPPGPSGPAQQPASEPSEPPPSSEPPPPPDDGDEGVPVGPTPPEDPAPPGGPGDLEDLISDVLDSDQTPLP